MIRSEFSDVSVRVLPSLAAEDHQCIEVEISGDAHVEPMVPSNANYAPPLHHHEIHPISYIDDEKPPFDEITFDEATSSVAPEVRYQHKIMKNIFSDEIFETTMDSGEDTTFTTFHGSDSSSDIVTHGSDFIRKFVRRVHESGSFYEPSASGSSCRTSHTGLGSGYACGTDLFSTMSHGSETSSDITHDTDSSKEVLRKSRLVANGPLHELSHHPIDENSSIEENASSGSEYEDHSESSSDVILTLIHMQRFDEEVQDTEGEDGTSLEKEWGGREYSYVEWEPESISDTPIDTQSLVEKIMMPSKLSIQDCARSNSIEKCKSYTEEFIQERGEESSESASDDDSEAEVALTGCDLRTSHENDKTLCDGDQGLYADEGLVSVGAKLSPLDNGKCAARNAIIVTPEQRKAKNENMTNAMFDYMLHQGGNNDESILNLEALSSEEANDTSAYDC